MEQASYDQLMAEQIDAARSRGGPGDLAALLVQRRHLGSQLTRQPLTDDLPGQLEHGRIVVLGEVGIGGQHDAVQLEGQPARVLAGR